MPDNSSWYHAAYVVVLGVYAVYAFTLWRRRVRVREELRKVRMGGP